MPNGVRRSLIAFVLLTGFAVPAAAEPATTWTDPPARAPEAGKASPRPVAATPAAVSSPRRAESSRARETHPSPRRVAARPRIRVAHDMPRRPVVSPPTPHRPRVVAVRPPRPVLVRRYAYPVYSYAGFPPAYDDSRLDRLSTAVGSGYLVMRGRTVEYPDGRVIRFYRPADDEVD